MDNKDNNEVLGMFDTDKYMPFGDLRQGEIDMSKYQMRKPKLMYDKEHEIPECILHYVKGLGIKPTFGEVVGFWRKRWTRIELK